MKRPGWLWPLIILISTLASWALYTTGDEGVLRALVIIWFICLCPGMAVVGLLGIHEPIHKLTLAVALSIALDLLLVTGMLYANAWSVPGAFALLSIFAASGAIAQLAMGQS